MFVGQLYGKKKKKLKKQTRSPEGEVGERQLDKGDQNVQTFNCKTDRYQGCNIPHD